MRFFLLFLLLVYVILGCEDHEYKSKRETEQGNLNLPPDEGDTVPKEETYKLKKILSTPINDIKITINIPNKYKNINYITYRSCIVSEDKLVISDKKITLPTYMLSQDSLLRITFFIDSASNNFDDNFLSKKIDQVKLTIDTEGYDTSNYTYRTFNYNGNPGILKNLKLSKFKPNSLFTQTHIFYNPSFILRCELEYKGSLSKLQKALKDFNQILKSIRFQKLATIDQRIKPELPKKLSTIPTGFSVTHNKDILSPEPAANNFSYVWKLETAVKNLRNEHLKIVEFGTYKLKNNKWVLDSIQEEPFSYDTINKEFYEVYGATIKPKETYTEHKNYLYANKLNQSKNKKLFYFIGLNHEGKKYKGIQEVIIVEEL